MTVAHVLRPYQAKAKAAILKEFEDVRSTLLVLPTGCHAAGTEILMYAGWTQKVEAIQAGDLLMGPDSTPRRVLQLARGFGRMYRIVPVKGEPFIVNEDHILTLVQTPTHPKRSSPSDRRGGRIVDVCLHDWLRWSHTRKHIHKLFRVPVSFQPERYSTDHFVPPYIAGVLLGDGSLKGMLGITTADPEIIEEVRRFAEVWNMKLRRVRLPNNKSSTYYIKGKYQVRGCKGSDLHQELTLLGMRGCTAEDKEIPIGYLVGSRECRLQLLAGLLDTDGSATCGGYDFISKSQKLAEGITRLSRSLGFAAYMKPCQKGCQTGAIGTYYRVSISGDTSIVPCRIKAKRNPKRLQKKDVLRTGFSVEYVGYGEYFGFSLDGDGRYVMGDFTVTHNTGKTQCFVSVAEEFLHRGRVMVLAHREELIFQAADRFHNMLGITPDIEMGELHVAKFFNDHARVIVSTVQTQIARGGRMEKFDPYHFSLVIVDEAHHAPADSWTKVIDYYKQNPSLKVLGVTATPDRADEEALGKVYETVAFDYELPDAIQEGWLVPITVQCVLVDGLDFSGMRTTAGDLNGADLAAEMEKEYNLHGIADATIKETGDKKVLVFASSVAHAERLSEIFNRHVPGCSEWICGKTPNDRRRNLVKRFKDKEFRILCNVGVATEGWDDPSVEVVVMGRPTKSRSLYAQMTSRGTRPLPGLVDGLDTAHERRAAIAASGKPKMEILDFVGNSGRHHLVGAADILGGKYSDEVKERARKIIEKESADSELPSDVVLALERAQKEIEEEAERKRREKIKGQAKYRTVSVDPFNMFDIRALPERGWDKGKQCSPKQLAIIREKMGLDPDRFSYTQQRQLLDEQFRRWDLNLASLKQLNLLRKLGQPTPPDMTFKEASAAINTCPKPFWWGKRA